MSKEFIHLHVHTEFSLLDGAARINKLFEACHARGMSSIAITDHGNMYGVVEFYKQAEKFYKNTGVRIKPIIGCEFYMCESISKKIPKEDFAHLVLLAKNEKGYKNLIKLNSIAFIEGFYYKPRIDMDLLAAHSSGLVALSGCLSGHIPKALLMGDFDGAKMWVSRYKKLFGDDFYIEIQDHNMGEQRLIREPLIRLARETNTKLVATNDVHYIEKKDAYIQDILMCVQTGKRVDDIERMKFPSDEFYLKTYQQMHKLFSDIPDALESTLEIADKCNVKLKFGQDLLPTFQPPNNKQPYEYLYELTMAGLKKRYDKVTKDIKQRAVFELETIRDLGFVEYFLIVYDFIDYAEKKGISVGAGRGSGVGSMVAYALGITKVEPLQFGLIFERFLNRERVSPPDFDIDFCFTRRGEVIDYVTKKYGAEKVAQIITFGTLAARAAIKDVGRVLSIPYGEVDRLAKLIPFSQTVKHSIHSLVNAERLNKQNKDKAESGESIKEIPIIRELITAYNEDAAARQILDVAMQIEGMPRNTSTHAAGVVICKDDISNHIPLQRNGEDITTQFNMKEVESLGLLKMDFLGLRTLTDIQETIGLIYKYTGERVIFDTKYNDENVFALIAAGETEGIFQLESPGMKRLMVDMQPKNLEDVIAGISLFRPGPMAYIPKYISARRNPKNITYTHPKLESILKNTYGVIVYQEQVIEIVQRLAGFSLGMADIVRRAMGKKDPKEMAKMRKIFLDGQVETVDGKEVIKVEGALRRGVDKKTAIQIFDDMEAFAEYAFNKSHAAAYAVLSYQTAYLKRYYPLYFMATVINNRISNSDEIKKYISHLKNKDIDILPPCVNKSDILFNVSGESIRFGLTAIKSVGIPTAKAIVEARAEGGDFKDLYDFFSRVDLTFFRKNTMEALVSAGAFDTFNMPRSVMYNGWDIPFKLISSQRAATAKGQFSMFDSIDDIAFTKIEYPKIKEWAEPLKLKYEKEVLGVYISNHPLNAYESYIKASPHNSASFVFELDEEGQVDAQILQDFDNLSVNLIGIITGVRKIITKQNKEMAYFTLEDIYGQVECIVFNKNYMALQPLLIEDSIVTVNGTTSTRDGVVRVFANNISVLDTAVKDQQPDNAQVQRLYLKTFFSLKDPPPEFAKIESKLAAYPGNSPVTIYSEADKKAYATNFTVDFSTALRWELLEFFDDEEMVLK
ncbi:MAG: DNA polymerase III subunit alpha [Firmicutes bacterium]|nr:DNA polymerase III subunit alpha [Bacillota bacterium]